MKTVIGIGIGAECLRVIALRGDRILVATETETLRDVDLAELVSEALAALPLPRFPRPHAVIALGPSLAHARRLGGLPPLADARLLSQVIREGATKFFLSAGAPLLTTGVRREADGTLWAGALDEAAVRAVEAGCRRADIIPDAFVPTVAVLPASIEDEQVLWKDGPVVAEARYEGGQIATLRRTVTPTNWRGTSPIEAPRLAVLGEAGWRFADAYGAATTGQAEPLAYRPSRADRRSQLPARRIWVASAAVVIALAAAAATPYLSAVRAEQRAAAQLVRLGTARREGEAVRRETERTASILSAMNGFAGERLSPTLLLSSVTRVLPAGTALITFRADSGGGSLTALAPRAAAVISALERVPEIEAPQIVGSVTHEIALGRSVDRVTVNFRLRRGSGAHVGAGGVR